MSVNRPLPLGEGASVVVIGTSPRADAISSALVDEVPSTVRWEAIDSAPDGEFKKTIGCLVVVDATDDSIVRSLRERHVVVPILVSSTSLSADAAIQAGATDVISPEESNATVCARVRNYLHQEELERRIENTLDDASATRSEEGVEDRPVLAELEIPFLMFDSKGVVAYATPAIGDVLGFTPEELEGRELNRFVHPDDRAEVSTALADLRSNETRSIGPIQVRLSVYDGTWRLTTLRFATGYGRGGDLVATVDRPGVEELFESGPVFDDLDTAIVVVGGRDELRYANRRGVQLFDLPESSLERGVDSDGTPPDAGYSDVRYRDVWALLPDGLIEPIYERVLEVRRTGDPVEFEVAGTEETGVTVWAEPTRDAVVLLARVGRDRPTLPVDLEKRLDAIDVGILDVDDGRISLANAHLVDLLGESPVGRDIDAVFDEETATEIARRGETAVVRWREAIRGTLGEADRPVSVSVGPRQEPGRYVCTVQDDRHRTRVRAQVETVLELIEKLEAARSSLEVCRRLAESVLTLTAFTYAACYRLDGDEYVPVTSVTSTSRDEGFHPDRSIESDALDLPPVSRDHGPIADTCESGSPREYVDSESVQVGRLVGVDAESHVVVPCGDRLVVIAGGPGHDRSIVHGGIDQGRISQRSGTGWYRYLDDGLLEIVGGLGALAYEGCELDGALRSIRQRIERDRRQRTRLQSLLACRNRIEEAVSLCRNREEFEERLCEELAALEDVALAWIGDVAGEEIATRTWAGRMDGYVDTVRVGPDPDSGEPTGVAAARFEPVLRDDLAVDRKPSKNVDHSRREERWRHEALDRGFQSVYSVPIVYDEYRYGVLSLYGERATTFDEEFQSALGPIGDFIGLTLHEIERRRANAIEGWIELELLVDADEDPLVRLTDLLGRRVGVETVEPGSAGRTAVVVSIEDDSHDDLGMIVESIDSITLRDTQGDRHDAESGDEDADHERFGSGRVGDDLGQTDDIGAGLLSTYRVEIDETTPSVVRTVAIHGGELRSLAPGDGGRTRVVVTVPDETDVRAFVTMLDRTHSNAELLARRSREKSSITAGTFFSQLADELTDRQLRTLREAYRSGYFESPRECTGADVAERLGVSQPTFNRHFRAAERRVFTVLFEEYFE